MRPVDRCRCLLEVSRLTSTLVESGRLTDISETVLIVVVESIRVLVGTEAVSVKQLHADVIWVFTAYLAKQAG